MSRILLVDDSPHAQRMGERILSDEGYEVVTVSNADSALIRLDDVDPDVVLADTVMPGRTGYEICQYLKMSPRHRYVRVILTAGVLEAFDEERAQPGGSRRHAEEAVRSQRLAWSREAAGGSRRQRSRRRFAASRGRRRRPRSQGGSAICHGGGFRTYPCGRYGGAGRFARRHGGRDYPPRPGGSLRAGNVEPKSAEPLLAPLHSEVPKPAAPPRPADTNVEPVRRITPVRIRSGSILGLDISRPETPPPDSE